MISRLLPPIRLRRGCAILGRASRTIEEPAATAAGCLRLPAPMQRLIFGRGSNSLSGSSSQVPGKTELRQKIDAPLGRIPVIPAETIAVIRRETMVEIVKAFAVSKQSAYPVV